MIPKSQIIKMYMKLSDVQKCLGDSTNNCILESKRVKDIINEIKLVLKKSS